MRVGIDVLKVDRIEKAAQNAKFVAENFTDYERNYIDKISKKYMRMAGIFCAKEAFLKALGIGIKNGIALNEIEVNHDVNGRPFLVLSDNAKKVLNQNNLSQADVSISHESDIATAICILN